MAGVNYRHNKKVGAQTDQPKIAARNCRHEKKVKAQADQQKTEKSGHRWTKKSSLPLAYDTNGREQYIKRRLNSLERLIIQYFLFVTAINFLLILSYVLHASTLTKRFVCG